VTAALYCKGKAWTQFYLPYKNFSECCDEADVLMDEVEFPIHAVVFKPPVLRFDYNLLNWEHVHKSWRLVSILYLSIRKEFLVASRWEYGSIVFLPSLQFHIAKLANISLMWLRVAPGGLKVMKNFSRK
jgi:hypothetical protein